MEAGGGCGFGGNAGFFENGLDLRAERIIAEDRRLDERGDVLC